MAKRTQPTPTLAELVEAILKYRHLIYIPENDAIRAPELVNWTLRAKEVLTQHGNN